MSGTEETPEPPIGFAERDRVLDQIEIWRKELINLARSNRLLYFRHTKSSTLEIVREPDRISEVVHELLAGGTWRFYVPPAPPDSDSDEAGLDQPEVPLFLDEVPDVPAPDELITNKVDARALRNALRLLDRRATQEFMDKGIWVLYVAAGVLQWVDPDTEESAESPLVLIPVQLARESPREPYELRRAEDDVVINPALAVRLAEFGIELPQVDEDEFDLEELLAEVKDIVSARPTWNVEHRLLISPFSFHKEVMFRDLLKNAEEIADHPLVQALALGAKEGSELDFDPIDEERLDEEAPPEQTATILDADATQRQCIDAAGSGRSFVMDGPPGTGKSQTIANVITELLVRGKTILFVSEKAAALEVVQKRLRAAGLDDYALELHSHKATRKEVAQQLGSSLEFHPVSPSWMSDTALSNVQRRRRELTERARAMNERRMPLGRGLHQAIGRVVQLQHLPQAPPPAEIDATLSADTFAQIVASAGEIERSWGPVDRGDDFLWRDLQDVRLDAARQQRTAEQVEAALSALRSLAVASTDAADALLRVAPRDFPEAEQLLRIHRHLEAHPHVPDRWLTTSEFESVEACLAERSQSSQDHADESATLGELVGERAREVDPSAAEGLRAAAESLSALPIRFELSDDLSVSEWRMVHEFVSTSASLLAAADADAAAIAEAYGLPLAGINAGRARELAELALLATDSAKPEADWVNPAVVETVEQATRTLQPLCTTFAEQREHLAGTFTDEILALDLEGLSQRFATVHTGLGKLKSGCRADKKTIAAATHTGKATKAALALLPQALEWQKLTRQLEVAEHQHASALGEHYYQRTDSDFQAITHALENVRRALEIAGKHLNAPAMQRELARGGSPRADLIPAAQRLQEALEPWCDQVPRILGTMANELLATDLKVAESWCRGASEALQRSVELGSTVEQVAHRPMSMADVRRAMVARERVAAIEAAFAAAQESDHRILGATYKGLETDWAAMQEAAAWTSELRALAGAPFSPSAAERLQHVDPGASELDDALSRWHSGRDRVLDNFLNERRQLLLADLNTTFDEAESLLRSLGETVGDIDEWVEHQAAKERLAELGVSGVIDFCVESRVDAAVVHEVVERACLERWADSIIEQDAGRLKHVRADQLDPLVEEFRKLDVQLIDHMGGRVIAACNARRPRTTVGAAGTIKREAEKQRKHMPVRRLLEEAGEIAQALKPCFMMSPLTVSQFLPPTLRFDAVIFDEASQVRPSDAINCVYRGRQLLVAGDEKQLPPTSFFEAVSMDGDDEWEEEQFDEFESILQLCKGSGGLRELPLRWHYRSQHEDLISYSNHSFYDGRLVTFPGSAHDADDLGVKFFHVPDGVYRRGTARDNPREAEAVVDRVMHWARESISNPSQDFTVGVVAFSEAQAAAIETALDQRRESAPELDDFFAEDRLDGFFVKNLENVQGDERDVMIFSVGYGRDENGKLTMNFGPLNRDGGKRRLNVAITRARRRVEVVSSITGKETEFSGDLREGPRHLQRYLDYAARGPIALALEIGESGLDAESPFEEEVIRTIRSWGYEVQPQVGTAGYRVDIGVKHPKESGHFALGVECDGWMYHSSKVARDRDRLRQEVLERLGWRIHRIWGTSWYRNRLEQEERLRAEIEAAIDGGEYKPTLRRRPETPIRAESARLDAVSLDEAPAWTEPYLVAQLHAMNPRQIEMHVPEAQPILRSMIQHVVEQEGPVLDEIVLRRVREAWNVGRAGHRIRQAFDKAVAAQARKGEIKRIGDRFLATKEYELRVRVPGDDPEARRTVAEVSRTELQLAVRHLVEDARRVSRDELTFAVARLFGWNRRGSDIASALDRAVDNLLREGGLAAEGGYIRAP